MRVERIVNTFLQSNTFVLSLDGKDVVCLVDVGDVNSILQKLGRRRVGTLLLTHAHYDHVYGITELLTIFPDCMVYGSVHTLAALKNDKMNYSYYYDKPLRYMQHSECELYDGQDIPLFDKLSVKVLITPGHTPGSTCFVSGTHMFTGDAFIPYVNTVTKLKDGNESQAKQSVEIIKQNIFNGMMIHPGHLCQYISENNELVPFE